MKMAGLQLPQNSHIDASYVAAGPPDKDNVFADFFYVVTSYVVAGPPDMNNVWLVFSYVVT